MAGLASPAQCSLSRQLVEGLGHVGVGVDVGVRGRAGVGVRARAGVRATVNVDADLVREHGGDRARVGGVGEVVHFDVGAHDRDVGARARARDYREDRDG